jgi:hypothetical protein
MENITTIKEILNTSFAVKSNRITTEDEALEILKEKLSDMGVDFFKEGDGYVMMLKNIESTRNWFLLEDFDYIFTAMEGYMYELDAIKTQQEWERYEE